MTGSYMCDAHALAFNTLLSSQETDANFLARHSFKSRRRRRTSLPLQLTRSGRFLSNRPFRELPDLPLVEATLVTYSNFRRLSNRLVGPSPNVGVRCEEWQGVLALHRKL
ncbi:hypothetical protein GCM10009734_23780 [Nonomuraea bangladeshensis]